VEAIDLLTLKAWVSALTKELDDPQNLDDIIKCDDALWIDSIFILM